MRYGLVSDIHSNLVALTAVVEALEQDKAIDGLICMGDVIGYGPQPNEVIEKIRSYPLQTILGNHDLAVIEKLNLEDFNQDAIDSNIWNRYQLNPENREWLESLSDGVHKGAFSRLNDTVTLAHGSPAEPIWQYLTRSYEAGYSFTHFDTPLCFVGHTHLPRIFTLPTTSNSPDEQSKTKKLFKDKEKSLKVSMRVPEDEYVLEIQDARIILNPGSVGQPRDGDKRAAYAIFDDVAMTVTFKRVAYDISATQALMMEYKLPSRLSMRLDYGL